MTPWVASASLPIALLAGGAVIALALGRVSRTRGGDASSLAAIVFLAIAFFALLTLAGQSESAPAVAIGGTSLRADGLAVFLGLVATGLGFAVAVFSLSYMRGERERPTYTALLLLLIAGIAGIGFAGDLFTLFVFFELMAISSYALVAFHRERAEAVEAGMKYIIMSGAGSLVALIGIGFVYMGSGTLDLAAITAAGLSPGLAMLSGSLLIVGFGVKAAIVPMHTWLPDAHSAAPSGISAMLSGIVIQSGLLAMVRGLAVFGVPASSSFSFGLLLAFFAVLTMTVGNLLAMHQRDIKRLLAYSSIAQVGYIVLGFGIGLEFGIAIALVGGLFHILNHALMKGGAFLTAGLLQQSFGSRDLVALRGAGRRVPAAGLSFGVFVLGLAGVPPTSGFLSKLLIASGAAQAGPIGLFFVIALIANSILSLAYYVPAVAGLLAKSDLDGPARRVPAAQLAPVVAMAVLLLVFGLWPDPILRLLAPAIENILGGA